MSAKAGIVVCQLPLHTIALRVRSLSTATFGVILMSETSDLRPLDIS